MKHKWHICCKSDNVDRENKKLNRKLCYEKFAVQYMFTNQNFHESKLSFFHESNFLKNIYVNKETLTDIWYFLLSLTI